MADNINIAPDIVGEVVPQSVVPVATDEVGGAHYQVVKLGLGAANAVDMHLDSGQQTKADSLPVVIASDQGALSVAGTITANLGTLGGAATESTLSALNAKVTACNTGAVAGTVIIQGYNETSYLTPHIDPSTASWQIVDYAHHEIHEGDSYYYHDVLTLGNAAVQDYVITAPDTTKAPHFVYAVDGLYGLTLELYEATDRAGTTAQSVYNRNRNSSNTATTTVHKNQSGGTTDGTRIAWRISGSGTAGGKLASSTSERNERVLKRNTKYIFRLTSAAASNSVSVELDWYEHTPEA